MQSCRLRLSRPGADRGKLPRCGRRRALPRAEGAAVQILLRRARLGTVRADLRGAGILSDPHRDRDPRAICRRHRGAGRSALPADRARQRRQHQGAHPACARCDAPAAYVPVDISREHLREAAAQLARDFPHVPVVAVCADYTRPFPLPPLPGPPGKRVGFFPGSTIGNFEPDGVVRFLRHCAELLGQRLRDADRRRSEEGRRRFSTPPITTAPASTRRSTSTCWSGSTASWTAISMSIASRMSRSTMPKRAEWSCT